METFWDVLCVGHAAYDLIYLVDHHPMSDEKCFASGLTTCGGGPAANAAVTVARLGGRAAFAGYLGEDAFGSSHFDEFEAEGVDTRLVTRGSHPTPLSAILVKPNGDRTVVNYKAGTPFLTPEQVDVSRGQPRVALFDGHEPLISLVLAQTARTRGITTVLDAGSVHRGTVGLLPLMDFVVASSRFALDYTQANRPAEALHRLVAPAVVITLGSEGLIWKDRTGSGSLPALAVDAVDTTGAGDTFHGAFALAVARGQSFPETLRYASAAAALCCTKVGARIGIPSAHAVEEFLGSRRAF